MATSQVRAFIERLSTDSELREKIATATNSVDLIEMCRAAGFDFTIDEFRSYAASATTELNKEFTDDELESISGGAPTIQYLLNIAQ